jgi:peptidoglycan/xylan/chitin deacetylase (PgdA/CDA1 family)
MERANYMRKEQIRSLSDKGDVIGNHSWDHQNVKLVAGEEWDKQLAAPKKRLEKITGKPVAYFAYPFGIWNDSSITHLRAGGHRAAFQLAGASDSSALLYTIRRMIVPGGWSAPKMHSYMKGIFNNKGRSPIGLY